MAERFWAGTAIFHAGMIAVSIVVARRWARRLGPRAEPDSAARAAVADAFLWLAVAAGLAIAAAVVSANGFTAVRMLSQALFAELVALGAWVAALLVRRGRRRWALALTLACSSLLAVYAEAYHREPTDLRIRRYAVDLSRGAAVRGRFRLLHLSDIQADRIGAYQRRALGLAAQQHADLVVMTGDYVQPRVGSTRDRATADLNQLLRQLPFEAGLGAYAVRGDVDADWPRVLEGTSIRPLSGERVSVPLPGGRTLCLVGLTPAMSHGRSTRSLLDLVGRAPQDCIRIVIGHGPDFVIDLAGTAPVELALAGHTHGGQVVLPVVGPPYTKTRLPGRYASGLNEYQGVPIHVSAGIGMERGTAPQIRFLCPPEVSVLEVTY